MTERKERAAAIIVWLGLSALLLLQAPPFSEPGMYYDEAFLAQQARDFVEPERFAQHPPGTASTLVAGRRFPTRNAAYLGSLKSQLLIPSLALFGTSPDVVRATTLCTALLALLFATLFAQRIVGTPIALGGAILVAFDPSFVFFGTYEWGPYTTLFLCRAVGLYCLTEGWQKRRSWLLAVGGVALGLGVYARADFAIVLACLAGALVFVRGRTLQREISHRPGAAALVAAGLFAGALPMLLSLVDVLKTAQAVSDRGGLAYKWQVLWTSLDGSHFYRLMDTGGLFEKLFESEAPASLLGAATLLCVPLLGWLLFIARRRRPDLPEPPQEQGLRFLFIAFMALALAMWLLPGAVRAHHMLNLLPLPHLLVAGTLVSVAGSRALRIAATLALLAIVASQIRVTAATRQLIAETGGRGRWSDAIHQLARELGDDETTAVVSLDWGFHEPLLFLTRSTRLSEPIWTIPRVLQRGRPWVHPGDTRHLYLVHDERYDLFGLGPKLLAAARASDAQLVDIRSHRDREGQPAFYSVRFHRPHQLVYDGEFEIRYH
jgi:hypothetical protein